MAFEEVIDLDCDATTAIGGYDKKAKRDNPTKAEGYFIGSKTVPSPKSKTGTAQLHVFKTSGGTLGIWGKTDLDRKLAGVTPGVMTRITFTGMQETKNNPMYKFRVEVDANNKIDVAGVQGANKAPALEDEGDDDLGPADDAQAPDELPPARAQAPRTPAATPDAARQAKVQALLAGRK